MARRYNQNDIEFILDKIRKSLIKKNDNNELTNLELLDREDVIILNIKTKKSTTDKKAILEELTGSGLEHGREIIEDAIELATD
jgi:hypothetical protein